MTNFPNRPKETGFETTLTSPINSTTTTVILNSGPTYASGGETTYFTILNPKGIETISATGWSGGTLSGVTRGVTNSSGGASSARAHPAGTKVVLGNPWQIYDDLNTSVDSKVDVAGDTMTGLLQWSGTGHVGLQVNSLTTAQRDATSPSNGSIIYNTTAGEFQVYQGGAWSTVSSGSTQPDASATVAGKVEIATEAEVAAGTDTGGTSAQLVVGPPELAAVIQDQQVSFAADAEASDTYVITLTPAPDAYATGQRFVFTANTANTGGATLNVNALGAKTIVKGDDSALVTGDIAAGQVVEVVYDGTNMVMTNLPDQLVNQSEASEQHYHDPIEGFIQGQMTYSVQEFNQTGGGTITDNGAWFSIATAASDNNLAHVETQIINRAGTGTSVHDKNPQFVAFGAWTASTAQEGFIGFVNNSFAGTSLENSAMTLDHFGFIVQDGTLFISVADGTTQSKTDISGTVPDVTAGHTFRATFDGTTASFWVDGTSVGTETSNVPDGNLTKMTCAVIADASAAAKTLLILKPTRFSYDET